MKMYYKYLVPCFLMGMLGLSCSQDKPDYDVEPIGCISEIEVNTEQSDAVDQVLLLVNSSAEFVNLSKGIVSNEWVFPEGVAQTADGEAVTSIISDKIEVMFIKDGQHSVIARQTFEKPLVYVGDKIVESKIYEKVIDVTVKKRMEVGFTAKLLNSIDEFVIAENAANEVEVGSTVTLTVTTTQDPTSNKFILTFADDSTVESEASYTDGRYQANAKITKVGSVDVKLVSENSLDSNSLEIKGLIQGMPSKEPFVAESYSIANATMLSIMLSGDADPATFEAAKSSFICNVTNSRTGFNKNIECQLGLNKFDGRELQLTLAEPIYGDDIIKLSYSASGASALKATDTRELGAITDITLQIEPTVITTNPLWSFEVDNNATYWDRGWQNGFLYSFVADPTDPNNTVLKIDMQKEWFWAGTNTADPQAKVSTKAGVLNGVFVEGDLYTFSYDLYIPSYGSAKRIAVQLADTPNSWQWNQIIFNDYFLDISGRPASEWFTITRQQVLNENQATTAGGSFIIQVWPDTIPDCIYVDNITVTRTTARP